MRSGGSVLMYVVLNLYAKDADAVFDRAVKAGAEAVVPLADAF